MLLASVEQLIGAVRQPNDNQQNETSGLPARKGFWILI
jgi:hypothetical protein